MSLSDFFRDGVKAIDLTEDPEEELEKMDFLRPGKVMMADTNVVKTSEGRWMMIAEGSSKKGKKLKNFKAMTITRVVEEGVDGYWVSDPRMESQFFHFSRLYGWEEEEVKILEEKAKKYPKRL